MTMQLVKDNALVDDPFRDVTQEVSVPAEGAVIVSLEQWQSAREGLHARRAPLGIKLKSDQPPELIASDLSRFAVVVLEFPKFRDGRAYSYARLLRERYGYTGELRAVGDVLIDQVHFMLRSGFNAFVLDHPDPLGAVRKAAGTFTVWYQPTGDGRPTAQELRAR
jgi:uncharacterized protein (DUF934 family)